MISELETTPGRAGELPAFARWPVLAIAGGVALALLMTSELGGYFFDELYFITAGRNHLNWGYADQPPLVPVLAAVMDTLFPGSLVALRLPATLASAGGVVLTALIARELGGRRRAQLVAAGAYAVSFTLLVIGHWLATYTIDPFWWTLLGWLLVRRIRLREQGLPRDHLLLWAGVVTALSLQTKFLVVEFWVAVGVGLLVFGPREVLRRPLLWAGAAIAAPSAVPGLLWQATHGWPQLQMGRVVAYETGLGGGRPGVLVGIVVSAGSVVGIVLACYGLWRLLRSPDLRPYRFLGATIVLVALAIVLAPGRANYAMGLYGLTFAAAAVEIQRHRPAVWWRWVPTWPVYAVSGALSLALLLVPNLMGGAASGAMWPRLAAMTADAYFGLPADERERTAILAESYPFAAAIDHFGPERGLPLAYSGYRGYGFFEPPPSTLDTVLYVGEDADRLREHFAVVREVTPADPRFETRIWLCEEQRTPWPQLWPQLRQMQ